MFALAMSAVSAATMVPLASALATEPILLLLDRRTWYWRTPGAEVSSVALVQFSVRVVARTEDEVMVPELPGTGATESDADPVTLKVTVPLVPSFVVTDTDLLPTAAAESIAKLAIIEVALATKTDETVTPAPVRPMLVPEVKFVPVRVTGTVVPCVPEGGNIEPNVGAFGVANS